MADKRCFVISPITDSRADQVFEMIIRPAAEAAGFTPIRGDDQSGEQIMEETLTALAKDPVVVAYLGEPIQNSSRKYWNSNVMFEIGYRLAKGLPVVLLCEPPDPPTDPLLPFDVYGHRAIKLPEDLNRTTWPAPREEISKRLRQWETPPAPDSKSRALPSITVRFGRGSGKVKSVSPETDRLFKYQGEILGANIQDIVTFLGKRMAPGQHSAFTTEQTTLIGEVVAGNADLHAEICLVFNDDPATSARPRAYLPVITDTDWPDGDLQLRVVYIDVTGVARKDPEGIWRAALSTFLADSKQA